MRPTSVFPGVLLGAWLCLAAAPAFASDADALDLSLPDEPASIYRQDPPGTWYGDTSGVPVAAAGESAPRRQACPTTPDGEESAITGSVTTGMGYSSRMGSSTFGAASVNYCKSYATEDGGERTINVQVNVGGYDGPGYYYEPGLRGPGPGFGPGPAGSRGGGRR